MTKTQRQRRVLVYKCTMHRGGRFRLVAVGLTPTHGPFPAWLSPICSIHFLSHIFSCATNSRKKQHTKKQNKNVVLTGRPDHFLSHCQPRPCLQEGHWSRGGTTASTSLGLEGRSARRLPGPRHNEALKKERRASLK